MKLIIKVCPTCAGNIKKVKQDWDGQYQNQKYTVPNLEYSVCADCGERIYPREAMQKIEAVSPAFQIPESVQ